MKIILRLVICSLIILSVPVFAGKPVIMVFGDSLSAGYGIPLKNNWVTLLEKAIAEKNYAYRVVNASISGDTTSSGLSRLPMAIKKHQPVIVLLELGGNDGLRGLTITQTRNNLENMLLLLKKKEIKVLFVGVNLPPNYGPDYTSQFSDMYQTLAKNHKVAFLAFLLDGVAGYKRYMQDDGIHPNLEGQPIVLRNIWKKLQPMLGMPSSD